MTPLDPSVLDALPEGTWLDVTNDLGVWALRKVGPQQWVEPGDGITLHTLDLLDGQPSRVVVIEGEDPIPDEEIALSRVEPRTFEAEGRTWTVVAEVARCDMQDPPF